MGLGFSQQLVLGLRGIKWEAPFRFDATHATFFFSIASPNLHSLNPPQDFTVLRLFPWDKVGKYLERVMETSVRIPAILG